VLLKSMTDEVAAHVLAHNYDQTLALSLLEMDTVGELEPHAQFMIELEAKGRLDRALEALPDAVEIAERAQAGRGLTRPELAVLLAYGKLELSADLLASPAPDDPYFEAVLEGYFPKPLRKRRETIRRHRLRREIIATVIANDMVNRCGPSFPSRSLAGSGADPTAFAAGYEAAKVVLGVPALWDRVAALDGQIVAGAQLALFRSMAGSLRAKTFWLARRAFREKLSVRKLIDCYGSGLKTLRGLLPEVLSPVERAAFEASAERLTATGAPPALAREAALLAPMTTAADLVDLAEASSWPLQPVARLYHRTGEAFGFDRLRAAVGGYTAGDQFERTAVRRLVEDLLAEQTALTRTLMDFGASPQAAEDEAAARDTVSSWTALRAGPAAEAGRVLGEIEAAGGDWTFAKLTIANAALRELAAAGGKGRRRR
jgi:glutamate dehydrogenase